MVWWWYGGGGVVWVGRGVKGGEEGGSGSGTVGQCVCGREEGKGWGGEGEPDFRVCRKQTWNDEQN